MSTTRDFTISFFHKVRQACYIMDQNAEEEQGRIKKVALASSLEDTKKHERKPAPMRKYSTQHVLLR